MGSLTFLPQMRSDIIRGTKTIWKSSRNEILIYIFLMLIQTTLLLVITQGEAFTAVKISISCVRVLLFVAILFQYIEVGVRIFLPITLWFTISEIIILLLLQLQPLTKALLS